MLHSLQAQNQANWAAMQQAGLNDYSDYYTRQGFISADQVIAHHRHRVNVYGDRSIPLLIAEIDRLRALLSKPPPPTYHWLGADADREAFRVLAARLCCSHGEARRMIRAGKVYRANGELLTDEGAIVPYGEALETSVSANTD